MVPEDGQVEEPVEGAVGGDVTSIVDSDSIRL